MYNPSAVVLVILNKNLASSGLPHVVSILSEHKAYCFMDKTIMICFIYHISKIQFILCVFHRGSSADHSFREKIPTSEKNIPTQHSPKSPSAVNIFLGFMSTNMLRGQI